MKRESSDRLKIMKKLRVLEVADFYLLDKERAEVQEEEDAATDRDSSTNQ